MSDLSTISSHAKHKEATSFQKMPLFIELSGVNSLVSAAMPLLLLLIKLRELEEYDDVAMLHRQVINEIIAFELRAKKLNCSKRLILAARYSLCTALDEVALLSNWGSESIWSQQSLLSRIQKETWGGERFYIILEKMSEEPAQNRDLLELLYVILELGFEGKYYNEDRIIRDEIKHKLFKLIMSERELPHRQLSPNLSTNIDRMDGGIINQWSSLKRCMHIFALILFLIFCITNLLTFYEAKDPLQKFDEMSQLILDPLKKNVKG